MNQIKTASISEVIAQLGRQARTAARRMAVATRGEKDRALLAIAQHLLDAQESLIEANKKDLQVGRERGLDAVMLERLELNAERIVAMAEGCQQIAALSDPVGEVSDLSYRPSGIQVGKMRVPLGVIGIIYESRPNVTIDAAALCLKSGNASILRGGSEAIYSNQAIAGCINEALWASDIPTHAVQLVPTTDRAAVDELITLPEYIDVIVPRGGKGLIAHISNHAKVPVIKHLDGICHVYIDADADPDKATRIAINAKTHRYGVCNAMETLLVHDEIAASLLPELATRFVELNVELRGCQKTQALLRNYVVKEASEDDWRSEYLAPILAIKTVTSAEQAVQHINDYGSAHTDSIVTENISTARLFLSSVDSASVMVNASTRFADGFEYGLGAEIGISTDKLHARGPVGLSGLTSQKYVVYGDGQIRE